jgi:hypothetical protein
LVSFLGRLVRGESGRPLELIFGGEGAKEAIGGGGEKEKELKN